ncbi:MAG: ABC transporter substrate-binding protein [Thermodesulfovibrionales bacterium]|nr:ABC transporter substrate-binding protein [Thermodesulfovibrionales bacterium]
MSHNKSKNDKDTLIVAVSVEPKRLNPLYVSDSISHHVSSLIFRGLTRLKDDLIIEGDLATHWQIRDGGKEVVFHLRRDVLWHDMKPFTAEDVVFTCGLLTSKESTSAYSQRFDTVKEIKAIDPFTVLVRYKKPYGSVLESWTIGILPKHIYSAMDFTTSETIGQLIGNGPFKIHEWISGQGIYLIRNEHFYGQKPSYKRLLIRIIPDETTQTFEFKKGNVDAIELTINQYNTLITDGKYNLYRLGPSRWVFLGLNLRDDVFKDTRFRKALSHAINKKRILQVVYQDLARLSNGPYPSNAWYSNSHAPTYDYDKEKALSLLNDIGFYKDREGRLIKDGIAFGFDITTNYENKDNLKVAQLIQQDLKEIGIEVGIRLYEWQTFRHRIIEDGAFQSVLLSRMYLFDPDVSQLWHSREAKKGGWNFLHYKNDEVDRLLDNGAHTIDKTRRQKIYQELHFILAREQGCIFLFEIQGVVATHKNIRIDGNIGISLFDNLNRWHKD